MNRNDPPLHVARRAAPPLSIPTPPRYTVTVHRRIAPAQPAPTPRPCGFCAKVRKVLGFGP